MTEMTPKQIVIELDKYIVGQKQAKKSVAIALRNRWRSKQLTKDVKDEIIPTYVAFPVTSEIKNGQKEVYYINELSFVLRASFPEKYKDEVIKTLKLWTLFGGVGARTRRGCGSLYCADLLESFSNEKDIVSFINEFGKEKKQLKYARISGAVFASASESSDAASAWSNMMRSYSSFRQDRRPTKPTPGRSYWPEPDAIRILTGQKSRLHIPEHPDGVWFPRAAFGLPILTKFNTKIITDKLGAALKKYN